MRSYRFNPRKLINNIIMPVQVTAGILLMFGSAGASDMGSISEGQALLQTVIGAGLILSAGLYKKIERRHKRYGDAKVQRVRHSQVLSGSREAVDMRQVRRKNGAGA